MVLHQVSPDFTGEIDSVAVGPGGSFRLTLPHVPDHEARSEVFFASLRYREILYFGPAITDPIHLDSLYLIQVYDQVAVMTGGGPGSTNVPYFVFQRSIGGGWEFGQASSYSIVVVIFSIIIATIALRVLSGLLKGEEIA